MRSPHRFLCVAVMAFLSTLVRAQAPSNLPEIAPGITLPTTGTVIALDSSDGTPTRLIIHATEIRFNNHTGGNFARSMVYAGPQTGVELNGEHAAVTLKSSTPVFYVRLPTDDPEAQRNRVTLLSLKSQKDFREVIRFTANVFGGSRKRHVDDLPITKEDFADGAWIKITPKEKLEPGEYGIAFLPKDKNFFGDFVYDFTIAGSK